MVADDSENAEFQVQSSALSHGSGRRIVLPSGMFIVLACLVASTIMLWPSTQAPPMSTSSSPRALLASAPSSKAPYTQWLRTVGTPETMQFVEVPHSAQSDKAVESSSEEPKRRMASDSSTEAPEDPAASNSSTEAAEKAKDKKEKKDSKENKNSKKGNKEEEKADKKDEKKDKKEEKPHEKDEKGKDDKDYEKESSKSKEEEKKSKDKEANESDDDSDDSDKGAAASTAPSHSSTSKPGDIVVLPSLHSTPKPSSQAVPQALKVSVSGVAAQSGGEISGIYLPQNTTYGGRPSWKKPDSKYWILHLPDKAWVITNAVGKVKGSHVGIIRGKTDAYWPSQTTAWDKWDGSAWQPQQITVSEAATLGTTLPNRKVTPTTTTTTIAITTTTLLADMKQATPRATTASPPEKPPPTECVDDPTWKDSKYGDGTLQCNAGPQGGIVASPHWCTGNSKYAKEASLYCPVACGVTTGACKAHSHHSSEKKPHSQHSSEKKPPPTQCVDDPEWSDWKYADGASKCNSGPTGGIAKNPDWCTTKSKYSEEAKKYCPVACGACKASCYSNAVYIDGDITLHAGVSTAKKCQLVCQGIKDCGIFQYDPKNKNCWSKCEVNVHCASSQNGATEALPASGPMISGPKHCPQGFTTATTTTTKASLWPLVAPNHYCTDNKQIQFVASQLECQDKCGEGCVGIAVSQAAALAHHCFLCNTETLVSAANSFGFYQKASATAAAFKTTTDAPVEVRSYIRFGTGSCRQGKQEGKLAIHNSVSNDQCKSLCSADSRCRSVTMGDPSSKLPTFCKLQSVVPDALHSSAGFSCMVQQACADDPKWSDSNGEKRIRCMGVAHNPSLCTDYGGYSAKVRRACPVACGLCTPPKTTTTSTTTTKTMPTTTPQAGPCRPTLCIFPFTYDGNTYSSCTNAGKGGNLSYTWCPSKFDNGRTTVGAYVECPRVCKPALPDKVTSPHVAPATLVVKEAPATATTTTTITPCPLPDECIFPLTYRGKAYLSCTNAGPGGKALDYTWCATKVDAGGYYKTGSNDYVKCPKTCQAAEAEPPCQVPDECIFPVTYREKTYLACTNAGPGKKMDYTWCATKVDKKGNYETGSDEYVKCPKTCMAAEAWRLSRGNVLVALTTETTTTTTTTEVAQDKAMVGNVQMTMPDDQLDEMMNRVDFRNAVIAGIAASAHVKSQYVNVSFSKVHRRQANNHERRLVSTLQADYTINMPSTVFTPTQQEAAHTKMKSIKTADLTSSVNSKLSAASVGVTISVTSKSAPSTSIVHTTTTTKMHTTTTEMHTTTTTTTKVHTTTTEVHTTTTTVQHTTTTTTATTTVAKPTTYHPYGPPKKKKNEALYGVSVGDTMECRDKVDGKWTTCVVVSTDPFRVEADGMPGSHNVQVRPKASHSHNQCKSITGDQCIFPFKYYGREYIECTDAGPDGKPVNFAWCPTAVDAHGNYDPSTGLWGKCGNDCQVKLSVSALYEMALYYKDVPPEFLSGQEVKLQAIYVGEQPVNFTIEPALPHGFKINSATGEITGVLGKSFTMHKRRYVVTASSKHGKIVSDLTFSVVGSSSLQWCLALASIAIIGIALCLFFRRSVSPARNGYERIPRVEHENSFGLLNSCQTVVAKLPLPK